MSDPIITIEHAAPAWAIPHGERSEKAVLIPVSTPVRLVAWSAGEPKVVDRGGGRLWPIEADEDPRAPIVEAEGRLWQAGTCRGVEGGRHRVGTGWLAGRRSNCLRFGTDLFAARTPLSRLALSMSTERRPDRIVTSYVDEARAGIAAMFETEIRLHEGGLYVPFEGLHVAMRAKDPWSYPSVHYPAMVTAHPRRFLEDHNEWYVVRQDRTDGVAAMSKALKSLPSESGPTPLDWGAKALLPAADRPADVLATLNAIPHQLIRLMRGGSLDRTPTAPSIRDLDLSPLRRHAALGTLGLIGWDAASGTAGAIAGVVDAGLARNPGPRIRTSLRNVRTYLTTVAEPVLGTAHGVDPEDALAFAALAP